LVRSKTLPFQKKIHAIIRDPTVSEGNTQIGEEAQNFIAVRAQAHDEVVGRGLFDAPASTGAATSASRIAVTGASRRIAATATAR